MKPSRKLIPAIALAAGFIGTAAFAQTGPAPYGAPITIEIVDSGAHLVMLQRLEAQTGSIEIATGKATTSAALRRPTNALEDGLAAGGAGLRILSVRSVTTLQGGVPILLDGKIIGAIGVSGVTAQQDEVVAMAGAAAVAAK